MTADGSNCGLNHWMLRPSSLDTLGPLAARAHAPQAPAIPRPAVDLGVLGGQLSRENTAVVQGCVPLV